MVLLPENIFRQHQSDPWILVRLQSLMGCCVYSMQANILEDILSQGMVCYNGTQRIGENIFYGSMNLILDQGARLLNLGTLAESLAPDQNILGNFHANELSDLSITLNNADHHLSQRIGIASFLNQTLSVILGYPAITEQLTLFTGRVTQETITDTTVELTAQNDNI